jgi:hypothetical protein
MRIRVAMTCVILGLAFTIGKTNPVWAALEPSPNPDFIDPIPSDPPLTEEQRALQQSIDIAPAPPASPVEARKLGYFYKYRSALTALYYAGLDSQRVTDDKSPLFGRVSLQFLFPTENLHALEASADLKSDNSGALGLSYRWIFSRTRFRPYTKLGAALRIDPDDQFATVLRLKNYQVRGSAGFEQTLSNPLSLRFDAELIASGRSVEALAGLGLVYAW